MGSQFRPTTAPPDRELQRYVPRAQDEYGGGPQGMALVGAVFGEDVMFDALAITDTTAHQPYGGNPIANDNPTGVAFDQVYAVNKTAVGTSTLNQSVSLQPVWSRDGTAWYAFGSATTVTAYSGSGTAVPWMIPLSTPSQYLPYVGVTATCATAPASGVLNGWVERLG